MKKKITPVFSVIILIFLVICAGILSIFIIKYTPSGTIIDGKDYFQLTGDDEAGQSAAGDAVYVANGRISDCS